MLKQIDHIGIAVRDLDESLELYERLFQVKAKHVEVIEHLSIRLAFIPVGEVMLELIEPLFPGKGRIGEFIDTHGEGFHHICYRVDNLRSLLVKMKDAGVRLREEEPQPGAAGSWIAFLRPEETNNVLTELVERKGEV